VDFSRHDDGEVVRRGAISVEILRETAPNLRDLTDETDGAEDGPATPFGDAPAAGG
jgi:hypothetical protein